MHTVLDCRNRGLPFSHKMILKGGKCMKIDWCQIRRVERMREYVPLKIVEENLCETRRVGTCIFVQKKIPLLNFPLCLFWIARCSLKNVSQYTQHWLSNLEASIPLAKRPSSLRTMSTWPCHRVHLLKFFWRFSSFLNPWHRLLLRLRSQMMDPSLVSCDYAWQELLSLPMVLHKEC